MQEPPQPGPCAPALADNGDVEDTLPDKDDQEALNMMLGGPANVQDAVPLADHQESVRGPAASVETPEPSQTDRKMPGASSMQEAVPPADHQESVRGPAAMETLEPSPAVHKMPGAVSMQQAVPPADHQESAKGALPQQEHEATAATGPAMVNAKKRSGAVMQALQRPNSFQLQA